MTMQSYDVMVRDVIMHAPHCPEPVAEYAVKMTTIDFCNRTHWWKYTSDTIDLVADENTYQVEVPNGTEPISVVAAWYSDRPLWPMGFSTHQRFQPVRPEARPGPPVVFTNENPLELVLLPTPKDSEVGALVMMSAIRPKRSATAADKDMMERWYEAIMHGALARVYSIPNQPFTSRDLATDRAKLYAAQVTQAKIDANKALTVASLRVQPRQPW